MEVDQDDLVPATLSWLHEMDHQFQNYLEDERGPSASQLRLRNLSSDTLPVWCPKVTRRNVGFTPGGLWQGGHAAQQDQAVESQDHCSNGAASSSLGSFFASCFCQPVVV